MSIASLTKSQEKKLMAVKEKFSAHIKAVRNRKEKKYSDEFWCALLKLHHEDGISQAIINQVMGFKDSAPLSDRSRGYFPVKGYKPQNYYEAA
ncbi:hypothetical protein MASR1M48_16500 [Lactococcus petauri]